MSARPLRVLASRLALDACGADVLRICADRHCELLASESAGATPDADIAFVSRDVIGRSARNLVIESTQLFFDQMRNSAGLEWLQLNAAGADRPIYLELKERGVIVTTASGANADVVAQSALAGFLALARRLPHLMAAQRARQWNTLYATGLPRDLHGQTAVIVGWGPIGRRLAALLKVLGLDVVVVRNEATPAEGFETLTSQALHQVLPRADWIFLACPLTPKTRRLMDAKAFAAMPRGGYLINVARGEVVVEEDLVEALRTGQLGGAFLDVFVHEPLDPASPLWVMDNVIVTPHSAGQSDGIAARVTGIFLENLGLWLAGRPLRNVVS